MFERTIIDPAGATWRVTARPMTASDHPEASGLIAELVDPAGRTTKRSSYETEAQVELWVELMQRAVAEGRIRARNGMA